MFSPVSFDSTPSSLQENEGQENGDKASVESKGLVATLQMKVSDILKQILQPTDVRVLIISLLVSLCIYGKLIGGMFFAISKWHYRSC